MQPGEFGTSSFEFYEGIRILTPGAAIVGLYAGVVFTFGLEAPVPSQNFFGAAVAALVIGLLLHFVDLPSRSTAYKTELPDEVIEDWRLPERVSKINFYFVLLDVDIPSGIRNRALYMGSMFRIGFELIYLLFTTAVVVIGFSFLVPTAGVQRSSHDVEPVLWTATALFVGLFVAALVFDLRNPSGDSPTTWGRRKERLLALCRQLGARGPLALLASVLLAVAYQCSGKAVLGGAAIAIPAVVWGVKYHKGQRGRGGSWKRLSMPVAALWFSWTGATLCALAAMNVPHSSSLGVAEAIGWLVAALLGGVLMQSRGPEKKLRGSYWTQRTWLTLNEEALRSKYSA